MDRLTMNDAAQLPPLLPEVRSVINAAAIYHSGGETSGRILRLNGGLRGSLFMSVEQTLNAAGGKWSPRDRGFLFETLEQAKAIKARASAPTE